MGHATCNLFLQVLKIMTHIFHNFFVQDTIKKIFFYTETRFNLEMTKKTAKKCGLSKEKIMQQLFLVLLQFASKKMPFKVLFFPNFTEYWIIYNAKSMSEHHFPNVWKKAIITPVPKGGDKHLVTMYRPISKLSIFGKIFEKIVSEQIYCAVKHHIIPQQHGFTRGRSVETNLISFTDCTQGI